MTRGRRRSAGLATLLAFALAPAALFATRGDKKMELRRMSPTPSMGYVPDGPLKWVQGGASP